MTNEEYIRQMSHEELYNFLDYIAQDGPWYDAFDKAICKHCEPVGQVNGYDVCQCELTECPYEGADVLGWWLKQQNQDGKDFLK